MTSFFSKLMIFSCMMPQSLLWLSFVLVVIWSHIWASFSAVCILKMLLTSISPINSNLPNAIKPSILIYNPITESEMFFRGCNKYKGVAKFVCCRLGFEKGFIWGLEDFMARVVVAHLESDMAVLLLPVQPPETILPVALRNTDSDYFCCFLTSTPTKL